MALEIFRLVGSVFVDTDEADKSLKKTDKEAENLGNSLKEGVRAIGKFAAGVVATATAAGASIVALTESTREYRTEQGKLITAFETQNFTAEQARSTYEALNGVLGDSGQAVEAANHLAKLTDNEKDLNTWTKICTGVYATFGDSLPIEGLTEAANETAKTGALTGSLADALNWAGVNEDDFQASLEACSSEQERQALITETLNGLYTEAADKYREVNAEVIEANKAQDRLNNAMAQVGAAAEPAVSKIKNLGAALLTKLLPSITAAAEAFVGWLDKAIEAFQDASKWVKDNEDKIIKWTGYIVAAGVAVGTFMLYMNWGQIMSAAAAALNLVTGAIKKMNTTIASNPIGLVISLITSLIAYLGYLYATNEDFRAFVDKMLSAVWAKLQVVVEWFKANVLPVIQEAIAWIRENALPILQGVIAWLQENAIPLLQGLFAWLQATALPILQGVIGWIQNTVIPIIEPILRWLLDTIGAFFDWFVGIFQKTSDSTGGIWETIKGFFQSAWDFIKGIWEACQPFFQGVWDSVILPVWGLIQEMIGAFQMAWDVIKLIWDYVEPYFSAIWEGIKTAVSILWTMLSTGFKNAWEVIKLVWGVVVSYFTLIWENIKAVFTPVVTFLGGLFRTAWEVIKAVWDTVISFFTLVWAGIKAVFAVVKGVLSGDFSDAWDAIKNVWEKAKAFFSSVWTGIKNVFGSIGKWFGDTFAAAWEAIKKVFSNWGSFFSGLWDKIATAFSKIGTNIGNAISTAVKAGINGVIAAIEGIINTGVNLINGAINLINNIPGVNIGKLAKLKLPRLERGGVLERGQVGLLEGNGAEAVVPLHQNRKWISAVARDMDTEIGGASGQTVALLQDILAALEDLVGAGIYLDTGALVGGLAKPMDKKLGQLQAAKARA